jgi:predicted PurR-regulated permease PerM
MQKSFPFVARATYFLVFVMLLFVVLIVARNFLIPVAFGLLLSSLLYPFCRFLCRLGLPKGLSIFISILVMMIFFGGLSVIFVNEIARLSDDFPDIKTKALENINDVSQYIEDSFGVGVEWQKNWLKERVNNLFASGSDFLNKLLNATAGTLFKVLLMPVFTFYILFYQERFKQFILKKVKKDKQAVAGKILTEMSFVSQRYFGGAFVVVVILTFVNTAGLYIIGLKYPILFGVISAFLNFIPYFGTWIGAFFPFMFAVFTGDTPSLAISVLILFGIVQFVENNILTPNITGGYVRLNPFITILGLIAGGMVWGVAGMLLVIPFMASLKIIFENIDSTRDLAFLIARPDDEPKSKFRRKIRDFFRTKKTKNATKETDNHPEKGKSTGKP